MSCSFTPASDITVSGAQATREVYVRNIGGGFRSTAFLISRFNSPVLIRERACLKSIWA